MELFDCCRLNPDRRIGFSGTYKYWIVDSFDSEFTDWFVAFTNLNYAAKPNAKRVNVRSY